ncbi:hypothetical protein [Streptacidiphilus fuscans]|uniref:Uncharacterized protein n=1 Tax=Streptacidiphilus fuscans TaxID=2789292 RepID=A0A931B991_9ACTN|nr:hypothetical protein [Streptacidiphilus fuscans]MBF9071857.1 hypothetical protein [Streptacidiphilus fuscans]
MTSTGFPVQLRAVSARLFAASGVAARVVRPALMRMYERQAATYGKALVTPRTPTGNTTVATEATP